MGIGEKIGLSTIAFICLSFIGLMLWALIETAQEKEWEHFIYSLFLFVCIILLGTSLYLIIIS